ncbi:EAL domain-containing protein [Legionella israelensis]|uniref:EAL domain-containing protein n=1 Tax=Legionella israelensis TaxID=454 RepID=UPI00163D7E2B|nr:EAL domain-containing protein [Legionella israelensis]
MDPIKKKRILLVDDNPEVHKAFYKIFSQDNNGAVDEDEAVLFDLTETSSHHEELEYNVDSAYQGQEALELVQKALLDKYPYALAFIDMRMPPGWDGIETIHRIWEADPYIQMVICTAYSDHSWEEIHRELGDSDNLLILKKPFEVIEINQLAMALTRKWELIAHLNALVKNRTAELENLYSLTQATLESTHEGILAVGLDKSILTYNNVFLNQWDIPEKLLTSEKSDKIFEKLAEQMEDPILFLKIMNELSTSPKVINSREWQLKTGTLLELYTQPQYLNKEITGVVYSFLDITERKQLENQLLHQATHDTLTGLPNRALLQDRIQQAIAHAKRFNLRVGILMIDLDDFKGINDTLGHKTGDLLLKCYAQRLSDFVRENDTVARFGGDEFVIILADQSQDSTFVGFLNKLVQSFLQPCQVDNHELIVTATVGVSIYPQDGQDIDILLKNADAALYHAKELGRNRFQFYMEEFNQRILQRTELKVALGQALQNKELSLNYQPLVDLTSNKIIGIEALLRWQHPKMGLIMPKTFIPVAEESGLILTIGEWVLRTACAQMKIWHQTSAFPEIKISVNISVKQFRDKNFVSVVRKVLEETQFEPEYLELEITESLILEHVSEVVHKMSELKTLGIRFAIDDFGTGYSSLSYLKHFPFDTIKIDKTFIDNITTDSDNASIVDAIIAMTKSLGLKVLAEGVEHKAQVDFLRKHHSNQVQGYYFSKPLTEQACTELLKQIKSF